MRRGRARLGIALVAGATAAASVSAAAAGSGVAAASSPRTTGRLVAVGNAAAVPPQAVRLGALPGRTPVTVELVLKPRHAAELAWLSEAVSTPGSPLRGHYLSVAAVRRLIAPPASTISALTTTLGRLGLRVTSVSPDHLGIHLASSAATVERALHASLTEVRDPGGAVGFVNTSAPELPAGVAGSVQAVLGLDSMPRFAPADLVAPRFATGPTVKSSPRAGTPATSPVSASAGPVACRAAASGSATGAWTATQMAKSLGTTALYAKNDLGQNVGVAVVEFEGNNTRDISTYESCYGVHTTVSYVKVDGGITPGTLQSGEAALDIETLAGLAPDVHEYVYRAPQTGFYDMLAAIAGSSSVKVVSMSWGSCEPQTGRSSAKAEAVQLEVSAAEGQSWFVASGDSGSTACLGTFGPLSSLAVNDPASQPFVTGVGGTTLPSVSPLAAQSTWNGANLGASGGGISRFWPMPQYQATAPSHLGVANPESSRKPCGATGGYCREVPDVSADANPNTGYIIYLGGSWYDGVGGTSAAAPAWASVVALTDAYSGCGGHAVGFADPSLYAVAAGTGYARSFVDVRTGNNDFRASGYVGGLFKALKGYDMATGLGAPYALSPSTGDGLARRLCAAAKTPRMGVDYISPASGPQAGGTVVAVNGYGFSASVDTGVYFGSLKGTAMVVVNRGLIEVHAPRSASAGRVLVTVHSAHSKTASVPGAWFIYG